MALRRELLRVLTRAAFTLLAVILLVAAYVPIQQRIFRYRAERLLSDIQAVELHKTSWAQAQALMNRWGAWGHYDGTCTWTDCKYEITLSDWSGLGGRSDAPSWFERTGRMFFGSPLYRWLGGRPGTFLAAFIVQDNTVWRTFLLLEIDVPAGAGGRSYEMEYGLLARVQSRSSLNPEARSSGSHWILGNNEQLAKHPNFKAGRPGGCENCMDAEITYSTATPQGEIRHLTSFNLSCLTRWRPCVLVEDVLPSSKPFHLHGDEGDPPQPQPPERSSKLCDIPVWALGRDAINVFVVDALSASNQTAPLDGGAYETAHVHLVETVKGSAPWPAGTVLHVRQNFGDSTNPPFTSPEHLMPGHRQLALVTYPFPEFDAKHPPPPEEAKWGPGFVLDRCELLDDTPLNRIELQRGFAQNDHLRVAEF